MGINEKIAKDISYMEETGNCPVLECDQRKECSKLKNRDFEYCKRYLQYAQEQLDQSFFEGLENLSKGNKH